MHIASIRELVKLCDKCDRLDGVAAGEELNAEHDQRKNQHDVNIGADRVEADPTEKPEHQENYEKCPKHMRNLLSRERADAGVMCFEMDRLHSGRRRAETT